MGPAQRLAPGGLYGKSRGGPGCAALYRGLRPPTFEGTEPPRSALWEQIELLRQEHLQLSDDIERRYHDFSDLDSRFHRLVNSVIPNRFIEDFQDVIALIFHYHYQWNKHDERQRNEIAIREHVTYMDALKSRNISIIELACRAHLTSAKETLIRSTTGLEERELDQIGEAGDRARRFVGR